MQSHYEVQVADRRHSTEGEPTKQFKVVMRHGPQPWHCEAVRYFRDRHKAELYATKKNEEYAREVKLYGSDQCKNRD